MGGCCACGQERLYENDSYLKECAAEVVAAEAGLFRVNQTVLYAEGGGQPGDSGVVTLPDGRELIVAKSVKQPGNPNAVLHYFARRGRGVRSRCAGQTFG